MQLTKEQYEQMSSEITELSVSLWDDKLEDTEEAIKLDDLWPVLDKYQKFDVSIGELGIQISEIINQEGDEKTDGQCIDEIIDLLNKYGLYKERI